MRHIFVSIKSGWLAIPACVVLAFGSGCFHDEATEHQVYIKAGTPCDVVDANDNIDVPVRRGDWVVWNNQVGHDVVLNFGTRRLFGVDVATVYASGDPLRLQVRNDAATGPVPHKYAPNCGTSLPGPGLIVCPPGQATCP